MVTEVIVGLGFIAVLTAIVFLIIEVRQLGMGLGAVLRMVPAIQAMDRIINRAEVPLPVEPSGLRYKGDTPPPYAVPGGDGAFFPHDVAGASRGVFTEPGPSVDEATAELLARARGD